MPANIDPSKPTADQPVQQLTNEQVQQRALDALKTFNDTYGAYIEPVTVESLQLFDNGKRPDMRLKQYTERLDETRQQLSHLKTLLPEFVCRLIGTDLGYGIVTDINSTMPENFQPKTGETISTIRRSDLLKRIYDGISQFLLIGSEGAETLVAKMGILLQNEREYKLAVSLMQKEVDTFNKEQVEKFRRAHERAIRKQQIQEILANKPAFTPEEIEAMLAKEAQTPREKIPYDDENRSFEKPIGYR